MGNLRGVHLQVVPAHRLMGMLAPWQHYGCATLVYTVPRLPIREERDDTVKRSLPEGKLEGEHEERDLTLEAPPTRLNQHVAADASSAPGESPFAEGREVHPPPSLGKKNLPVLEAQK